MNNLETLLKTFGIEGVPTDLDRGQYEVTIESSNAFENLCSKISANNEFEQDIDEFSMDENSAHVVFRSDFFTLELSADFNNDQYVLNIYEVK